MTRIMTITRMTATTIPIINPFLSVLLSRASFSPPLSCVVVAVRLVLTSVSTDISGDTTVVGIATSLVVTGGA